MFSLLKQWGNSFNSSFPLDTDSNPWQEWRAQVDLRLEELKVMMKNFESIITSRGLVCACILHSGSVGEGIIEIAKENKVTLIVMGTRGQNKIRRTFLGSSSDYCLHQSGLPVTVIPDPNQTS